MKRMIGVVALIALAACARAAEPKKVPCPAGMEERLFNIVKKAQELEYLVYFQNPDRTPALEFWEFDSRELRFLEWQAQVLRDKGSHYGKASAHDIFKLDKVQCLTSSNQELTTAEGPDYAEVDVNEEWFLPAFFNSKETISVENRKELYGSLITYKLHRSEGKWLIYDSTTPRPKSWDQPPNGQQGSQTNARKEVSR